MNGLEGFEWTMDLKDEMSRPAEIMKWALVGLEVTMREVGKSALAMGKAMGASAMAFGAEHWRQIAAGAGIAAAAIGGLVYEGVRLSLEASEMRTHMTEMFAGLGGGEEVGKEMYASIQKLRTILPESEKELGSWAAKLMGAGMVDPKSVNESIKAIASASALMGGGEQGEAAASKVSNLIAKSLESGTFKGMAKTLVGTGVSAEDLAAQLGMTPANFQAAFKKGTIEASKGIDALNDVLQRKGKGALAGAMTELPVMALKAKETLTHMFDAVDVKPITEAFRQMVAVLDTSQPSGRAMKLTITDAFTWIARVAGQTIRALTLGFLYVELGVLKLMHVFAPLILQWRVWERSGAALMVVKIALGGMALGLLSILTLVGLVLAPIVAMGAAFMYATQKVLELKQAITGTGEATSNMTKMAGPMASSLSGAGGLSLGGPTSPAHATGGVVGKPAPGEYFASVAPGETIVPRGMMPLAATQTPAQPATSGTRTIHVDVGGIRVDGAGKSAGEIVSLLESSLADIFERAAIEAGA